MSCASPDKKFVCIKDATHYYSGQKDKLAEAVGVVIEWLSQRAFVSVGSAPHSKHQHQNSRVEVSRLREKYDGSDAMQISGFNHLALVSSDMERTCEFYGGVLGLRLEKTISLPGGGQHFFFALDGTSPRATGSGLQ